MSFLSITFPSNESCCPFKLFSSRVEGVEILLLSKN